MIIGGAGADVSTGRAAGDHGSGVDQIPERERGDGDGGRSGEVLHRGHHAGEDQVVSGVCGESFVLGRYWLDF